MNKQHHHFLKNFRTFDRNVFKFSWDRFLIYSFILLLLGSMFLYYFNIYFFLIFSIIFVFFWVLIRIQHQQKLKKLMAIQIPDYIWQAFYQRHPNMSLSSKVKIEEGFKDYLALHLWQKKAYAMPSHAVDALWHLLIEEFQGFYFLMCQNTLGYELKHQPHAPQPTRMQKAAQQQQLMNTWQAACQIQYLNPKNTSILPHLFQVDTQVKWENGIYFKLPLLIAMYVQLLTVSSHMPPVPTNSSCSSGTTACSSSYSGSSSRTSHSCSDHEGSSNSDSGSSSDSSCSSCGGGGD